MRICYLPIFLAVVSLSVTESKAQHIGWIRLVDTQMSSLMTSIMTLMIPSEAMSAFADFQQSFSRTKVDSVLGSSASLRPVGRKRIHSFVALETQLNRIQNEINTLERMMGDESVTNHGGTRSKRSPDPENDDSSSDVGGKAVEVGMKGAEMAGNGMKGAKKGADMASDGAQGAKAGADALGNGAEMAGKGAETFGAAAQKGQEIATSFSG